jgi:hypothetical protein
MRKKMHAQRKHESYHAPFIQKQMASQSGEMIPKFSFSTSWEITLTKLSDVACAPISSK